MMSDGNKGDELPENEELDQLDEDDDDICSIFESYFSELKESAVEIETEYGMVKGATEERKLSDRYGRTLKRIEKLRKEIKILSEDVQEDE